jgi:hypothetical protein
MDVRITGFDVGGEVLADEAIEEGAKDILLEVPAIDSAAYVVGDFPNLALQGGALLDACHSLFLKKVVVDYFPSVALGFAGFKA